MNDVIFIIIIIIIIIIIVTIITIIIMIEAHKKVFGKNLCQELRGDFFWKNSHRVPALIIKLNEKLLRHFSVKPHNSKTLFYCLIFVSLLSKTWSGFETPRPVAFNVYKSWFFCTITSPPFMHT